MLPHWHSQPHVLQLLHVNVCNGYAGRQRVVQLADDCTPRVDDQRMAIALSLAASRTRCRISSVPSQEQLWSQRWWPDGLVVPVVLSCLGCRNDIALHGTLRRLTRYPGTHRANTQNCSHAPLKLHTCVSIARARKSTSQCASPARSPATRDQTVYSALMLWGGVELPNAEQAHLSSL